MWSIVGTHASRDADSEEIRELADTISASRAFKEVSPID